MLACEKPVFRLMALALLCTCSKSFKVPTVVMMAGNSEAKSHPSVY